MQLGPTRSRRRLRLPDRMTYRACSRRAVAEMPITSAIAPRARARCRQHRHRGRCACAPALRRQAPQQRACPSSSARYRRRERPRVTTAPRARPRCRTRRRAGVNGPATRAVPLVAGLAGAPSAYFVRRSLGDLNFALNRASPGRPADSRARTPVARFHTSRVVPPANQRPSRSTRRLSFLLANTVSGPETSRNYVVATTVSRTQWRSTHPRPRK